MEISIGSNKIRSFMEKDTSMLAKYANNPQIAANMQNGFPSPFSEKDAEEWIEKAITQRKDSDFAIASDLEVIGGIGFTQKNDVFSKSAEVGYWVAEPFWGQGIATKALTAIIHYAFSNFDLIRIYAAPFECNPASSRVLEKTGFQYEGRLRKSVVKNGIVMDQLMYSLLREEWKRENI